MSAAASIAPLTAERISLAHELSQRFKSSQYQIEQPYIQIRSEGYTVVAEDKSETYRAERPRHIFRTLLGRGAGLFALATVLVLVMIVGLGVLGAGKSSSVVMLIGALIMLAAFPLGFMAYVMVAKLLSPIRRATLWDAAGKTLVVVEPTSSVFLFNDEYRICDADGRPLAFFRKRFLDSFFRTRWHCHGVDGAYLYSAVEDSMFLSLLRRYTNFGKYIPMHFMFSKMGGKPFGQFERRYSLRDRYRLNYNARAAEGWLMVVSAILLDTGENR